MPTLPAPRRKAIYAFAGALAAAAAFWGLIEAAAIPVILGVVFTGTNLLALVNVTTDDDPTDDDLS